MKPAAIVLLLAAALTLPAQSKRIVIAAGTILDGQGRVFHNTRIVIEGPKILAINPKAAPIDYDLRGLTVLPGWIDSHVHITWSFGKDGKNAGMAGTTQEAAYQSAANAWATLMAGFTTVQSVGSPTDVPLRDAIAGGALPGPRILTAIEPLMGRGAQTGTPEEIRVFVRKQKDAGADLIKVFASGGMRQGPMTLSPEQLNAAWDEAKKQGLRTLVHAYRDAVRAATLAGCTQVEHGLGASDDDLRLMAEKGVYFDPQAGLLLETYLLNAAMVSANSLAAEALGMSGQIGTIAPGLQADVIGLDGNPQQDITAVRRVVFVMKSGVVYKTLVKALVPRVR